MNGPIARRSAAAFATALILLVWLNAGHSDAERSGHAGVIVSLDGSVSPLRLPRQSPVPVSLTLTGSIESVDGSPAPRLSSIELAFGGRGGLSTAGLPVCSPARLRNVNQHQALASCGNALVGHGVLSTEDLLDPQRPVLAHAGALVFNGKIGGRPAVWVQVYSRSPPVAFVLPFQLHRRSTGSYGIVLRGSVAQALGRWLRLRSFQLTFGRRYTTHGVRHSYLVANCPLPPRLHIGLFALARATYHFAPAPILTTTILRSCRARD